MATALKSASCKWPFWRGQTYTSVDPSPLPSATAVASSLAGQASPGLMNDAKKKMRLTVSGLVAW